MKNVCSENITITFFCLIKKCMFGEITCEKFKSIKINIYIYTLDKINAESLKYKASQTSNEEQRISSSNTIRTYIPITLFASVFIQKSGSLTMNEKYDEIIKWIIGNAKNNKNYDNRKK